MLRLADCEPGDATEPVLETHPEVIESPEGCAAEVWFHERTEAGKTLMAARAALEDRNAPFPLWFYIAPGHL